jgi:hypothetical protein
MPIFQVVLSPNFSQPVYSMSIKPFTSDKQLLAYARWFLRHRVDAFYKDTSICMTRDKRGSHAYFPALITCIAFADLLAGLYVGKLNYPQLADLKTYVSKFFRNKKDYVDLEILYLMFQHKIAHIAYPYLVFDTSTKKGLSPHRRITWTVGIFRGKKPIELIDYPTSQKILKTKTAWPVPYTSRMQISLIAFRTDIVNSIYGPSGYMQHLKSDPKAREHFAACMKEYAPP